MDWKDRVDNVEKYLRTRYNKEVNS